MKVLAIITGYNEAGIIIPVLQHLKEQEIDIWYMDNESNDGTMDLVQESGLCIGTTIVERPNNEYRWQDLLKRKESIAYTHRNSHPWFMHHDADEFRFSPWEDLNLREAVEIVDVEGFSAIDHVLIHFPMIKGKETPFGHSPRPIMDECYIPGLIHNNQVKILKSSETRININHFCGHRPHPDMKTYPIGFIMEHYPARNPEQIRSKVLNDRIPSYLKSETDMGWHNTWPEWAKNPEKSFYFLLGPVHDYTLERAQTWALEQIW